MAALLFLLTLSMPSPLIFADGFESGDTNRWLPTGISNCGAYMQMRVYPNHTADMRCGTSEDGPWTPWTLIRTTP